MYEPAEFCNKTALAGYIEPAGGNLTLNGVSLKFPSGAVEKRQRIRMHVQNQLNSDYPEVFISLEPHNMQFKKPITVSISVPSCGERLKKNPDQSYHAFVSHTHPLGKFRWEPVSGVEKYGYMIDEESDTISWRTTNFSFYACLQGQISENMLLVGMGTVVLTVVVGLIVYYFYRPKPSSHSSQAGSGGVAHSYPAPVSAQLNTTATSQNVTSDSVVYQLPVYFRARYKRDNHGLPNIISFTLSTEKPADDHASPHDPVMGELDQQVFKAQEIFTYDLKAALHLRACSDVSVCFKVTCWGNFFLQPVGEDGDSSAGTWNKHTFSVLPSEFGRLQTSKSFNFRIFTAGSIPTLQQTATWKIWVAAVEVFSQPRDSNRPRCGSNVIAESPIEDWFFELISQQVRPFVAGAYNTVQLSCQYYVLGLVQGQAEFPNRWTMWYAKRGINKNSLLTGYVCSQYATL